MSGESSGIVPSGIHEAFDFLTKHFAVLSVVVAFFGALTAIIFISAYLRVFDWRLIWIIQYSDVLKVGLTATALFSGFAYWIWFSAKQAIDLREWKGGWPWVHLFGLALWLLSLGHSLYGDYYSAEPRYELHFFAHASILAIFFLASLPMFLPRELSTIHFKEVAWVTLLAVLNISTLGTTFGYYTRDTSGFRHDIFLKDRELRDMGLIMITSQHVVLLTNEKTIIVVPAADVTQLQQKKKTGR